MSIPERYAGKLSPEAASIYAKYPNEAGWDFLPLTNGKVDFICIHCSRTTEKTWEARVPCECQKPVKAKK